MRWLPIFRIRTLTWFGEPLAALISPETLQNILNIIGYPAVTIFVMIESSGIPFPGETMLLLASFYAAVNHQLQIPVVIACAAFGAIVGDNREILCKTWRQDGLFWPLYRCSPRLGCIPGWSQPYALAHLSLL